MPVHSTRWAAVAAAALALGGVAPVGAAGADADPRASTGEWSAHFREDGFDADGNTDGCTVGADGSKTDCLPPGASQVVLPDGRILYWSAIEGSWSPKFSIVAEGGNDLINAQSRVMELAGDGAAWTNTGDGDAAYASEAGPLSDGSGGANSSLFCADQALLPDGTVVAFGGTDYYNEPGVDGVDYGVLELEGTKTIKFFDPRTSAWSSRDGVAMKYGRWYPSKVTLPDGRILVAGGVTKLMKPVYPDRPEDSGTNVTQTEVFDPRDNSLSTTGSKSFPLYPRLHLLPNGDVYYGAAGQAYNPQGQSYDEATWNFASVLRDGVWQDIGLPGQDIADPEQLGFRGSSFQQMLPLKAPYTNATFLTAGGVMGTTPGSYLPTAKARLDTVDVSTGEAVLSSEPAGDLNQRRWYGTGVTLPTGEVLVVSGADVDHVVGPGGEQAITTPELYDPESNSWTQLATTGVERTYHNNAVLLPDGRVLVGGHDPIPAGYGAQRTLPGVEGVRKPANNTRDASFQIFSPPYLFKGHRPSITGEVQQELRLGDELTITTHQAKTIDKVVLVRNTAQTHLIDGDQRAVELEVLKRNGKELSAQIPSNPAVLPPGPYMLFVVDGGVPSVARQVTVGYPDAAVADPGAAGDGASAASVQLPVPSDAVPAGSTTGAAAPSAVIDARRIASRRDAPAPAGGAPVAPAAVVAFGALVTVVAFARRRFAASSQ